MHKNNMKTTKKRIMWIKYLNILMALIYSLFYYFIDKKIVDCKIELSSGYVLIIRRYRSGFEKRKYFLYFK
jgi:hypothetical protein